MQTPPHSCILFSSGVYYPRTLLWKHALSTRSVWLVTRMPDYTMINAVVYYGESAESMLRVLRLHYLRKWRILRLRVLEENNANQPS